jgi:hypothetical protein
MVNDFKSEVSSFDEICFHWEGEAAYTLLTGASYSKRC